MAALSQLALRAQDGDRSAFELLLRRLDPGLKQVLRRRTGQAELADELAHQTWIAVWQALREERYDVQKAAISTFVYAVAHKLWLQHLRRSGSARFSHEVLDALPALGPAAAGNPASDLHASELLDAMRSCLRSRGTPHSLTADERRVVMGLATGESERTLAEQLGVAASTVHARKQLAYQKLRRCLAARGFSTENAERGETRHE